MGGAGTRKVPGPAAARKQAGGPMSVIPMVPRIWVWNARRESGTVHHHPSEDEAMSRITRHWMTLLSLTFVAACGSERSLPTEAAPTGEIGLGRGPELDGCDSLAAPAGTHLVVRLFATGDQVYRWDGQAWVFVAPSARLYLAPRERGQIGIHYAGPTWESLSHSKVVGAVSKRCTPDTRAIPWLLLTAVSSTGPGLFDGVTAIQRLHTTGGLAPATPGTTVGQTANVPYTAEYRFYRPRHLKRD